MTHRENALAVLRYESCERLPIVHFGFWNETLAHWAAEGHLTAEQAASWSDGNAVDDDIGTRLGFDLNWYRTVGASVYLRPTFESRVLEELPDGSRKVLNRDAVVVLQSDDARGIPPEIDHLLKGRAEWEEHFLPRLKWDRERVTSGEDLLRQRRAAAPDLPLGLMCGSLFGWIRDWMGMVGISYLQVDDPDLFSEIIRTVADLCYQGTEAMLQLPDASFDFGHFWEDICFKNGPLVQPSVFREHVAPGYRRITELLARHGIDLVSLDCDGDIDALVPIWLDSGVNVMFPMEVGTWGTSIEPWRRRYGRAIRGVGGMDKRVLAHDRPAIDAEIERLRPLVDLGGYIPCPDHRLPPNATWDNVRYYCERMRAVFA